MNENNDSVMDILFRAIAFQNYMSKEIQKADGSPPPLLFPLEDDLKHSKGEDEE